MKLIYTLLIIIFSASFVPAQEEWSEPIQIAPDTMSCFHPDMVIDNSGTLHCVWSHKIDNNFFKIYYSKSQDKGETWTEPEDISLNTHLWMAEPHLAVDSENNLYLTYDYNAGDPNNMHILFKKFNGTNWSEPDTISVNMPGSMHNKLIIDNNNRIYVFWNRWETSYYRYFEYNIWNEIYCVFDNDSNYHTMYKAAIDNENNIYCIGFFHYYGQSHYEDRVIYFTYNYIDNIWSNILILNDNRSWQGSDIDIDNSQLPHVAWGEYTSVFPDPTHDATFYTYFNGSDWMPNEIVVEDPSYQTIAIDQYNHPHIVNREKTESGKQLVHYNKYQNNWEGTIIDESYSFFDSKLIFKDSILFFIYKKLPVPGGKGKIMLSKYIVPVSIPENAIKYYYSNNLNQNYPNPFNTETTIHFYLNKGGYTTLKILDLQGRLVTTLINEYKEKGEYIVNWNSKDKNGKEVTNGLYLYRLQVGRRSMTRSLQLVK